MSATGPKVLTRILNWMGFSETWVVHWQRLRTPRNPERGEKFGRVMMVASRKEGLLEKFESVEKPQEPKSQRQERLEGLHDQPRRQERQRRPKELRQQRDRGERIQNLERQLHDRDRSLEESKEGLQRLRRERRRLQSRIIRLEQDLQNLQATWPWRLSEMLRRTKAKLLRVGRGSS
jgi:chromosome segregation ATPase